MKTNEIYIKKIDSKGNFIHDENNDFVMELVSVEEIPNKILTEEEKKQLKYQELLPTDWYFVRQIETGIEVPAEILLQRTEIREKYK